MRAVQIDTADGRCPATVHRPPGTDRLPAVIVYMDGIGIRPALHELADRIAAHGYVVLLPDLFYRPGGPATMQFTDPAARRAWVVNYISTVLAPSMREDTRAFLDFLAAQPDVVQPQVATTGYCMGGAFSLEAAGRYPDRVIAAASFHGGRLATDEPTSPHLLASAIKARVYVAGAIEDPSFPDDMKARLEHALLTANVAHVVETYPAKHGWVPRDHPMHDPACAERHYTALFELLDATLPRM